MATGTASGQVIGDGGKVVSFDPAATVTKGDVYEGEAIGVWLASGVSGDTLPCLFGGHVTLTKATGYAPAVGELLYWNTTSDHVTSTATDTPLGMCTGAEASGAVLVDVWCGVFES